MRKAYAETGLLIIGWRLESYRSGFKNLLFRGQKFCQKPKVGKNVADKVSDIELLCSFFLAYFPVNSARGNPQNLCRQGLVPSGGLQGFVYYPILDFF